jgi:hypothetical protein
MRSWVGNCCKINHFTVKIYFTQFREIFAIRKMFKKNRQFLMGFRVCITHKFVTDVESE